MRGAGSRASQRSKNAWICVGPNRSQMTCNPAGSSVAANPFAKGVQPILAMVACRFAHSWPFNQTLIGYREVGADLDERRPEIVVRRRRSSSR